MRDIRVATVQFQHAPGDRAYNLGRVRHFVTEAARANAEIIAFPEMCLTGYWHVRKLSREGVEALAEPVPEGPSTEELLRLAREHGMTIGAGLIERADDGQLYNGYVVAMPNGNNIVENARATALAGAEILLAPHQTGGCNSVSPRAKKPVDPVIWARRHEDPESIEKELRGIKGRGWLMRWLPSRAHDNGMFLLFSNGIGPDDDEIRTGNAMVLDPYGEIIAETCAPGDDMVVAELVASLLPTSSGRRWLRARRPELYESLTRRTGQEQETRRVRFGD